VNSRKDTRRAQPALSSPALKIVPILHCASPVLTRPLGETLLAARDAGATTAYAPYGLSITPGTAGSGPRKKATATIVVLDEGGAPVPGAEVTGTFSGSHDQTITATTDANGAAMLVTSTTSSTIGFTLCVNTVTKTGMTYDPAANVETCDAG
jgi:hypothetical protein